MTESSFPVQLGDRCVMCGLCIPHCPTYSLSQSENESPRGRISLMMAMAKGKLKADAGLITHLDHCLGCRACEGICPSDVPYGRLLDSQRQILQQQGQQRRPWSTRLMMRIFASSPARLNLIATWLHRYQAWGLRRLVALFGYFGSPRLRRMHRYLPMVSKPVNLSVFPADTGGAIKGRVNLFSGCASRLFDQQTRDATIFLLQRLGYVVNLSAKQVCCGAMHLHEGDAETARRLAATNIEAFSQTTDPIISTASGCTTQLTEYAHDHEAAASFSRQIVDISDFLANMEWPQRYQFAPLKQKIVVHEPCLQRNILKQGHKGYEMLNVIPELDLQPLDGNRFCCGAAGSQMLSQPKQADALLAPKLAAIDVQTADILVTTNIGCALHIQAGLKQRGKSIEVIHPVTLLARQLRIRA